MYILRDYQEKAVASAKRYFTDKSQKKPALMVLPTGSGKSLVIAEIARVIDAPLIVFQPTKEILEQNYNKMMDYGIFGVTIYSASMRSKEIGNITLATIGSVYRKPEDFMHFKYIIMDECFIKGTLIDGQPIETLKKGDIIRSYDHYTHKVEYKKIKATSKRRIASNLIKINLENGTSFICTENHPIYTLDYGYISAYSLSLCIEHPLVLNIPFNEQEKDISLYGLRKGVSPSQSQQKESILQRGVYCRREREQNKKNRSSLLYLWNSFCIEGTLTYKCLKNGTILLFKRVFNASTVNRNQESDSHKRGKTGEFCEDERKQSYVDGWDKGENDTVNAREDISCERGKWRTDKTTTQISSGNGISNRILNYYKFCKTSISKFTSMLQGGFSGTFCKISNRSRWENAQVEEVEISRQTEDGSPQLIRVAGCEIYKRGSGREFKSVCGDGYVYNLEIEDNHNYFVNNILVHNCHLCNAKGGMYKTFFDTVGEKILGLTATPYRLSHDGFGGSILKFLTRTNPRVFSKVIHVTQTKELSDKGFFSKTEYFPIKGFNRAEILLNSTGADYREDSERTYYDKTEFNKQILKVVKRLLEIGKTRILVFTKFVAEAKSLAEELGDVASTVDGEMKAKLRDKVIKDFRSGVVKVVCNVGVLTVGFDYPELEVVVIARPTRSLTLYYQMLGRCVRPHPSKDKAMIVDMCGNYNIFGRVEDMDVVEFNDNIWCVVSGRRRLTNVYLNEIMKD